MRRERFRLWWDDVRWPVTGLAFLGIFILGYVGSAKVEAGLSATDTAYRSLQLFLFEGGSVAPPTPWQLDVARFAAPALAGITAAAALASVFRTQLQLMRARSMRGHVVVCGLGDRGVLLATRFHEAGYKVVGIESVESDPHVGECRALGIPVIIADASQPLALHKAKVARAQVLIAVCEEDRTNAAIVSAARDISTASGKARLTCIAHVVDLELCTLLRSLHVDDADTAHFCLELFNVAEAGARMVLDRYPAPVRKGAPPRLLVVGLGKMGRALVDEAARRWWREHAGVPLEVVAIDRRATQKKEQLLLRYPHLADTCHLTALDMEKDSCEFERGEFLLDAAGRPRIDAAYLCFEDDAHALEAALLVRRRLPDPTVPIVVRMSGVGGLESLVPAEQLHCFGLLDETCVPALLLAQARAGCVTGRRDDG